MLAWTIHQRGLCPKCGYPRSVCRSSGAFEAQREVCHASAAVEKAQEEHKSDNDHGVMWIPEAMTAAGDDERPTQPPPGMFGT